MGLKDTLTSLLRRNRDEHELFPAQDDVNAFLTGLAAAFPENLKWEEDDYIGGALAVIEIDAAEHVLARLTQQLGDSWDRKSIKQAPAVVGIAVKDYGGLREKQRIFATGLTGDLMLLGLWWPWGHGGSVSIRLVPWGPDAEVSSLERTRAALSKSLRIE